jgi:hypothetical protein
MFYYLRMSAMNIAGQNIHRAYADITGVPTLGAESWNAPLHFMDAGQRNREGTCLMIWQSIHTEPRTFMSLLERKSTIS